MLRYVLRALNIQKISSRTLAMAAFHVNNLPIGIEVIGIDLKQPLQDDVKKQIMQLVTKHRMVVFRNQGKVDGSRQAEISRWFGDIDNTAYSKHPASPSIDIFCVSNDPKQGCTGVGMSGWHIDGTFRECPYAYSVYHMVSVARHGGDTLFIPLTELVEMLSAERRSEWERLWMMSDRQGNLCHPLIYRHPQTGRPTLCLHQGMTAGFVRDYDKWQNEGKKSEPDILSLKETEAVMAEIQAAIDEVQVYSHKWQQTGDFIISDNLAVGHMAGAIPLSVEEAGLRILHRVTVKGTVPPNKSAVEFLCKNDCAY